MHLLREGRYSTINARKNLTIGNSNEKTSESYLTTIKEFNPELVIIDNYDVDCAWEREIKKLQVKQKLA